MREWAEQLVATARQDGVALTGEGGLLTEMMRHVLQTGLEVEMAEHLGYELHERGRGGGNARNGSYDKTATTEIGEVELRMPRDRQGTFTPVTVPKYQRRLDGLSDGAPYGRPSLRFWRHGRTFPAQIEAAPRTSAQSTQPSAVVPSPTYLRPDARMTKAMTGRTKRSEVREDRNAPTMTAGTLPITSEVVTEKTTCPKTSEPNAAAAVSGTAWVRSVPTS
jgi:hypothetical protein